MQGWSCVFDLLLILVVLALLQAYISSYTSHTKVDRLLFIAEHSQGKPLELEALKLAADEVKQVRAVCCQVSLVAHSSDNNAGAGVSP